MSERVFGARGSTRERQAQASMHKRSQTGGKRWVHICRIINAVQSKRRRIPAFQLELRREGTGAQKEGARAAGLD